jgi:hypothetical protein
MLDLGLLTEVELAEVLAFAATTLKNKTEKNLGHPATRHRYHIIAALEDASNLAIEAAKRSRPPVEEK